MTIITLAVTPDGWVGRVVGDEAREVCADPGTFVQVAA